MQGRLRSTRKVIYKVNEHRSDNTCEGAEWGQTRSLGLEAGKESSLKKGPLPARLGKHREKKKRKKEKTKNKKSPVFVWPSQCPGNLQIKDQTFPPSRLWGSTCVCEPHTPWGGDSFAVAMTNVCHTPSGVLPSPALLLLA